MELMEKATIIADIWVNSQDVELRQLAQDYDLGFPYAFGIANGHIHQLSDEGEQAIHEAWSALCDLMDIDENGAYLDFEHMALTMEA